MSVSDNFLDRHDGMNFRRSMDPDAEDQPVQPGLTTGKITSFAARSREPRALSFTAPDEMVDQIERIDHLLEAQTKFLNEMQASFKEALAEQGIKQQERLLSFKEAMIEQRDQISKLQAALMGTVIENSKLQLSMMGAMIEQRDQISKLQLSFTAQAGINAVTDNRGATLAHQPGFGSRPFATNEQDMPAEDSHIICMVAMPFNDSADTFRYKTVLLPALRFVLERSPYYWQVMCADEKQENDHIKENIQAVMKQAHAYIVDISDLNPNVMMELGYLFWAREPDRPLIVLKREGISGRYLADLGGVLQKTYPATSAEGNAAIEIVAEALRKEFRTHQGIQTLNRTRHRHFLSPVFLSEDCKLADDLANKLSQDFVTLEAIEDLSEPDFRQRTKGLQLEEMLGGARKTILRKLKELTDSHDHAQ